MFLSDAYFAFMKILAPPLVQTFRNFLPLKPYFIANRWMLLLGLVSLLLVDYLQLLIPLVIKGAINLLTVKTATTGVLFLKGATILGIALLMAFFRLIWRHCIMGHSRKVEQSLRNRLYAHVQTLSPSYYDRTKTGDLMAVAINDLNAVRMAAGMGLVALTDGLVLGLAAVGFMISINLKLTLISLIPAPIIIVLTRICTRKMSSGFENVQKTFSDLTERVREAFAGIRVIKAYGREGWTYKRLEAEGQRYVTKNLELAKTLAFFFPMMTIFTNLGLGIVIWLGGRLTILGNISMGEFVAFTAYLNLLTWPMMAMGWVISLIQRGSASMRRINRILDETPEIRDLPGSQPLSNVKGNIEVKGLTLRYPGKEVDALKDIRLHVKAGETLALVGQVGSGKSTLLHAIPRLLKIPAGRIFLDGRDIVEFPLQHLRRHIGFVPQDVFVFSDTIRNNVVFGNENISEEKLLEAIQIAGLKEEIQALDNGLDTMLGERGITLSGGQRQRLTIARAMILNPPILVFDDALSMVDTRTEEKILNRVLDLRGQKTNLLVSHRVSTISRADRIAVFKDGTLAELGTHAELLTAGGHYARLYERQLLAAEIENEAH
jgi:ATP-binding cassette subfamily B protein